MSDEHHQERERDTSFGKFIRSTQLIIVLWFGVFLAYVINTSDSAVSSMQQALGTLYAYNSTSDVLILGNCNLDTTNYPLGNYFCKLFVTTQAGTGDIIFWTMLSLGFLVVYVWITERYELRRQAWHPREALLFMYVLGLLIVSFFPLIIRYSSIGTLWFPQIPVPGGPPIVVNATGLLPSDQYAGLIGISTDVSSLIIFGKYFVESMTLVISIELMWLSLTIRPRHQGEFWLLQLMTAAAIVALNVYEQFNISQFSSVEEYTLSANALGFVQYSIYILFFFGIAIWVYGIYMELQLKDWQRLGMPHEHHMIEKPHESQT